MSNWKIRCLKAVPALLSTLPFLVGIAIGGLCLLLIQNWEIDIRQIINYLSVIAVTIIIFSIGLWIFYRFIIRNVKDNILFVLDDVFEEIKNDPDKTKDPETRRKVWSIAPDLFRVAVSWFGTINAIGLALLIVTNVTILATLGVQMLQAQRLQNQNDIMSIQTASETSNRVLSLAQQISLIRDIEVEIKSVISAYEAASASTLFSRDLSKKIAIGANNLSSLACTNSENRQACGSSKIFDITNDVLGNPIKFKNSPSRDAFIFVIRYLQIRERVLQERITGTYGGDGPLKDYHKEIIERAVKNCFNVVGEVQSLKRLWGIVRQLESNAGAVALRIHLEGDLVPQSQKARNSVQAVKFSNAISGIPNYFQTQTNIDVDDLNIKELYSMQSFMRLLSEATKIVGKELAEMRSACEETREFVSDMLDEFEGFDIEWLTSGRQ